MAGEEVLTDPRDIESRFRGSLDLIVDGGILVSDPSTVISLVDDNVVVLREGKGPRPIPDRIQK
jgi:tRNA A37 threonylcarbamoyladenosine synthetase subunit TsaC/SUA5/YrdC